jgi:hypothetical protein
MVEIQPLYFRRACAMAVIQYYRKTNLHSPSSTDSRAAMNLFGHIACAAQQTQQKNTFYKNTHNAHWVAVLPVTMLNAARVFIH